MTWQMISCNMPVTLNKLIDKYGVQIKYRCFLHSYEIGLIPVWISARSSSVKGHSTWITSLLSLLESLSVLFSLSLTEQQRFHNCYFTNQVQWKIVAS